MKSLNERVNLKTQQNAKLFIAHDVREYKRPVLSRFQMSQSNRQNFQTHYWR